MKVTVFIDCDHVIQNHWERIVDDVEKKFGIVPDDVIESRTLYRVIIDESLMRGEWIPTVYGYSIRKLYNFYISHSVFMGYGVGMVIEDADFSEVVDITLKEYI